MSPYRNDCNHPDFLAVSVVFFFFFTNFVVGLTICLAGFLPLLPGDPNSLMTEYDI
jgi:hypothetical protein